jgi:RimJ/RimL family protein N-acetyltransferase
MNISLREVANDDLPIFYEHQADPVANQMAVEYTARDRDDFMAHCARIRADDANIVRTIVCDGQVAGNVVSFFIEGKREVGYWIGREYWGKGIATLALQQFLDEVKIRPLYGIATQKNIGSQRVLEKCGFKVLSEGPVNIVYVLE